MPRRVGKPRQYRPLRTRRNSPDLSSLDRAWATASGDPSKSSGRQNRSVERRTRSRTLPFTLAVFMNTG